VKHPQELFRVAQELATILLYQLDQADDAIKIINRYCADSPLDTSTILFDAYHRMADWEGCLKVLRECLLNVEDDTARSVLHFKIAGLHEHLGQDKDALENYSRAVDLWPMFLDAVEGAIGISIANKDWDAVEAWLKKLGETVVDERLKGQLGQALGRLSDGRSSAGAAT